MATATLTNVSVKSAARSANTVNFGSALRSFFAGFGGASAMGDTLQVAAQLGPEQLKEVGGFQDLETGLVYGSQR